MTADSRGTRPYRVWGPERSTFRFGLSWCRDSFREAIGDIYIYTYIFVYINIYLCTYIYISRTGPQNWATWLAPTVHCYALGEPSTWPIHIYTYIYMRMTLLQNTLCVFKTHWLPSTSTQVRLFCYSYRHILYLCLARTQVLRWYWCGELRCTRPINNYFKQKTRGYTYVLHVYIRVYYCVYL